jgi:biopolymer transport protein ExbB
MIEHVIAVLASVGGGASTGSEGGVRTSLAEAFFIQRHPVTGAVEWLGSLIVWFLLALSAVCVSLLIARANETRRSAALPEDQLARARNAAGKRSVAGLRTIGEEGGSDFATALASTLEEHHAGREAMTRAAEQAVEHVLLRRLRRLEPLSIIGNVAPMIGLFGTVYGMIVAFREIVVAGGTPDPVGLAAGIGTALTTTFWGLVVAIPALAGHAALRTRAEGISVEISQRLQHCIDALAPGETPARDDRERRASTAGAA